MKKLVLGILVVLSTSAALYVGQRHDGRLHVYFLNIGQGDAILVRTPSDTRILIDGGPGKTVLRELSDILPFFDDAIDYAIITNPDKDHMEGFIEVFRRYRVGRVLLTGIQKKGDLFKALLKTIRENNIPIVVADEKSDLAFPDGVTLDILYPFSQMLGVEATSNNSSIVTRLIYGGNEILFTGDAEAELEEKLLRSGAELSADILKVAHHGSKTSSTKNFLKAVRPKYSVISAGKGNSYGHPHLPVLQRFNQIQTSVLRTDTDGRIEFIFSPAGIETIKTQSARTILAPSERSFSSNRS